MRPLERLQQSLAICAPAIAQRAALAAFDATEELEGNRAAYGRNRALLLARLPEIGLDKFAPPDGAFYIYADMSAYAADSTDFCKRLLIEAGVATTPGLDFDPRRGATTIRGPLRAASSPGWCTGRTLPMAGTSITRISIRLNARTW